MHLWPKEVTSHLVEIVITQYDPTWPNAYAQEKALIMSYLNKADVVDIQHFGSTSVPGLAAKPIIDIIVGLRQFELAANYVPLLEKGLNYSYSESLSVPGGRLFLQKSPWTHHLHLVEHGTEHWIKPIIFRDHLRVNEQARLEYERLKKNLSITYRNNRAEYTKSKTDFVNRILENCTNEGR